MPACVHPSDDVHHPHARRNAHVRPSPHVHHPESPCPSSEHRELSPHVHRQNHPTLPPCRNILQNLFFQRTPKIDRRSRHAESPPSARDSPATTRRNFLRDFCHNPLRAHHKSQTQHVQVRHTPIQPGRTAAVCLQALDCGCTPASEAAYRRPVACTLLRYSILPVVLPAAKTRADHRAASPNRPPSCCASSNSSYERAASASANPTPSQANRSSYD
jgi:hypothetical protein